MQARLYNDLTRGSLSETLGGGEFSFPKLVQNDDVTLFLRLAERVDGSWAEVDRTVTGVVAAIGQLDARPVAGTWSLMAGAYEQAAAETAGLAWNATADAVSAALAAIPSIGSLVTSVVAENGSWLVYASGRLSLSPQTNMLRPLSFIHIDEDERPDGSWYYEIRLARSPIAFTDQFERVLPPPPSIRVIQEGTDQDGIVIPEVQALTIPPWFRGIFRIRRGDRVTREMDPLSDGPDQYQEAMQAALWTAAELEAGAEFQVDLVQDDTLHIRFMGVVAGQDFELLGIAVVDAPPGDIRINLNLKKAALRDLFRLSTEAEPKLELTIKYRIADETQAAADQEPVRLTTGYSGQVTLKRSLIEPDAGEDQNIDWLKPESPKTYRPFGENQIIIGTRHATAPLGAGLIHQIQHGLGTDEIASITIRQNAAGGRVLRDNEYTVALDGTDALTITLDDALAPVVAGDYAAVIATAGPEEHFQAHEHTIEDVLLLTESLQALSARIAALEALAPSVPLTEAADAAAATVWPLPDVAAVLPARALVSGVEVPDFQIPTAAADLAPVLTRRGVLLPALHDVAAEPMPTVLGSPRDPELLGRVFENVHAKAKGGIRPGGFAATDGTRWYEVVATMTDAETKKGDWFPAAFELELWGVGVNERQLVTGSSLVASWGFEAALVRARTAAQWVMAVEYGTLRAGTAFEGENLEAVDWAIHAPLMRQVITLGSIPQRHDFGLRIIRRRKATAPLWEFSVDGTYYGRTEAGLVVPAAGKFALRSRLIEWDTEDSRPHAGFVALRGLATGAGEQATAARIVIS